MTPSEPGPLQQGERVAGRYLLNQCIGDGGHAAVWSALDEREQRPVALKFLRPECCDVDEAMSVLQQESQLARRVDHPGVLWVDEPQRDCDLAFLPMEYATGDDIKSLRGTSYLQSVPTLIQVAQVLAHAHSRGVIHRDIKAGNVLRNSLGEILVADFGSGADSGSQRALAAGSPFSASPQQLRGAPATPADDIYGLGALAYELLSGYPPFYPDFDPERVQSQMPTDLRPVSPAPPQLLELVMAMLARDPQSRPQDMNAVIQVLRSCLTDARMIEETAAPVAAAPRRSRTPIIWVGVAAGIAVLGVLVALLVRKTDSRTNAAVPVVMAPVLDMGAALEPATDVSMQGAEAGLARTADATSRALKLELETGRAALAAGQVAMARAAFERALNLQPKDPDATKGIADAARLERVLALHSDAVRAEAAGQLDRAAQLFTSALKVDPSFAAAVAGLARVRAAEQDHQLDLAVLEGNAALKAGRLDVAQSAYSDAARIRPADPRATAGLAAVADAHRKLQDARDQQGGMDLERQERWAEAVALYESVTARDPALAFARQGLERSRPRAALAQQLEDYSKRPERLAAPAVRTSAEQAIARATAIGASSTGAPSPVLKAQAARVRELLAPYAVPTQLEISSDNSTRIFIARVGDLGSFTSRELTLLPGRYTVIGTRAGFRDVRHELTITPGQRHAALSVQCTERI